MTFAKLSVQMLYGEMESRVRWALFISILNDDIVYMNIVDLQIQQ